MRFWLHALLWTLVFAVAIGIPTVVIDNSFFRRMTPIYAWQYAVWASTSVASGFLVATRKLPGAVSCRVEGRAVVGNGFAYLAAACPICNKAVILVLGTSGAMNYFAPIQPLLGVGGIALVLWALKRSIQATSSEMQRLSPKDLRPAEGA